MPILSGFHGVMRYAKISINIFVKRFAVRFKWKKTAKDNMPTFILNIPLFYMCMKFVVASAVLAEKSEPR